MKAEYIRKLSAQTKIDIQNFYLEGGITMSLPEAQYANTLFLNRSLKEACEMFNSTPEVQSGKYLSPPFLGRDQKWLNYKVKYPSVHRFAILALTFRLLGQALSAAGVKGVDNQ